MRSAAFFKASCAIRNASARCSSPFCSQLFTRKRGSQSARAGKSDPYWFSFPIDEAYYNKFSTRFIRDRIAYAFQNPQRGAATPGRGLARVAAGKWEKTYAG